MLCLGVYLIQFGRQVDCKVIDARRGRSRFAPRTLWLLLTYLLLVEVYQIRGG